MSRMAEKGIKTVALSGNPNVGKSTVFNALTGLNQHTGNWPGKTVANARGVYTHDGNEYALVDIPGTYSLMANSPDEEIARDFLIFGKPDAIVVVADATCLERNLNLVLQILEVSKNVVVCVNLQDEARKKHISIDLNSLEDALGVPVVGTNARDGDGLAELKVAVARAACAEQCSISPHYSGAIERAIASLTPIIEPHLQKKIPARFAALRLLDQDETFMQSLASFLGSDVRGCAEVAHALEAAYSTLDIKTLRDEIVAALVKRSEEIHKRCVTCTHSTHRDRRIDKFLTSKATGIPTMLMLLALVFWLTITGANYPSALLSDWLFYIADRLRELLSCVHIPAWLISLAVDGIYRTLAWVVSVMLPPMAIFFPLFTLLEDSGYLPRIAFNMDKFFKKAGAHGKQSLTMCMGFGCNACGVIGCRIIDSPRERLIAILTNNFVPCNGRFPTLIAIITMFFAGVVMAPLQSAVSALMLVGVILLGVFMTLFVSKILSKTLLRGISSSFALELPPYRRPKIGRVIVRSILDRTVFVLGRAVAVAAPAGLVIWLLANINVGGVSILAHCTAFLDPAAHLIGLDGVILMAFILGFPANEIVVPIIIMAYLSTGQIMELGSLSELRTLLVSNGWTWVTAVCTMLFSLMHFPCGTTCLTIYKETKSIKWTALSILIPTACGVAICFIIATLSRLI
ncbi:MAG: ferrous iron transport protein B [Clostridia bacterium]